MNSSNMNADNLSSLTRLGILGGMGVLASAKFHREICSMNVLLLDEVDQISTILISNPNVDNRSMCILNDNFAYIYNKLKTLIHEINAFKISHLIICCFTAHIVIDKYKSLHTHNIISLVDYTLKLINESSSNSILVLCTSASSIYRIFGIDNRLVYPNESEQNKITSMIDLAKKGRISEYDIKEIRELMRKYNCDCLLLGCTDFYNVYETIEQTYLDIEVINPLRSLAEDINKSWINN